LIAAGWYLFKGILFLIQRMSYKNNNITAELLDNPVRKIKAIRIDD